MKLPMDISKEIQHYLEVVGLSEREIKVYMALLEGGSSTVLKVSKVTGIGRTGAHLITQSLLKKDIIYQSKKASKRLLIAHAPSKLKELLKKKEEILSDLKQKFPEILKKLERQVPSVLSNLEVNLRYYEGDECNEIFIDELMKGQDVQLFIKITNKYQCIIPDMHETVYKKVFSSLKAEVMIEDSQFDGDFLDHPIFKKYKNGTVVKRIILPKKDTCRHAKSLYQLGDARIVIGIFDDKVLFLSENSEKSLIILTDRVLSIHARYLFHLIWANI